MKYTPIENNKIETRVKARGTEWLIEAWMGRSFPCYSIFKARKAKDLIVWEGVP